MPPLLTSQTLNCAGASTATLGAQVTARSAPWATLVCVAGVRDVDASKTVLAVTSTVPAARPPTLQASLALAR